MREENTQRAGEKDTIAQREEKILRFWQERRIFERSLEKPAPKGEFVFYEGPPTANGRPGIHHLLARAFKDAIPRYRTMCGYHVRRKGGWDTHGLPVELEVEKELGLTSKKDIEQYGVAAFNERCKASVWTYVDEWRRFTERSGYWVDLDHAYITYKPEYIEAVWGVLKHIHERGFLYQDYKVVPWCPRCGTALSSHELAQGYREVKDWAVYVTFKLKAQSGLLRRSSRFGYEGRAKLKAITHNSPLPVYLLAWTTTPWTLPGNLALAVHDNVVYGTFLISHFPCPITSQNATGEHPAHVIIALHRAREVLGEYYDEPVDTLRGSELIGLEYEPLYPFLQDNVPAGQGARLQNAYKVYAADFVTIDEGTGIVHTAVMYGQDDFELGTKEGLPKHHLVDESGHFVKGTGFLEGKFVRDEETAVEVINDLAHRGLLLKKEKYEHSYPHCWRCKTPLIYYARDSWYIKMFALRDELVKENEGINWIPAHIKEGRFGEWLREVKDWAISRERYWGTPLPLWHRHVHPKSETAQRPHTDDVDKLYVIGSLEELKKYTKKSDNRYFVMRHGEAVWNTRDVLNADARVEENTLTGRGREEVGAAAARLAGENIDLIVHSPLPRARETAEQVAAALGVSEVREDPRLAEVSFGEFEGKSVTAYHSFFNHVGERLTKQPEGGETWAAVKRRVGAFLYELEGRERDRRILIVSHNGTLQMLLAASEGLAREETAAAIEDGRFDIATAEVRQLHFTPLPHNGDYELDLHRPYIDELELVDEHSTPLRRVGEVLDVWFDSGAMPFAQDGLASSDSPLLYPADFISEAIDQTRGWFYTLHAIGALMERGKAYKNVISLGHILDPEGKKMSKSVGNVVDPWAMMERYGADALRFWMYSVNQPGDAKNFDEKAVDEAVKKVCHLLENIVRFYETYASSVPLSTLHSPLSTHILDQWILARLEQLLTGTTQHLDAYRLFEPARDIREFIADFSQWYIRRSRERFKGDDIVDKEAAVATTRFVLRELAKVMAPFTPFSAEYVWQRVRGEDDEESVHVAEWPEASAERKAAYSAEVAASATKAGQSAKPQLQTHSVLLEQMEWVRRIAALGLRAREGAGIAVKQPLWKLETWGWKLDAGTDKEALLQLVRDEVNVKEVVVNEKLGEGEVRLDTTLTDELKEEGEVRAFVRVVQECRKKAGLSPNERATVAYATDETGEAWLQKHRKDVSVRTKVEFERVSSVEDGTMHTIGAAAVTLGMPRSKT